MNKITLSTLIILGSFSLNTASISAQFGAVVTQKTTVTKNEKLEVSVVSLKEGEEFSDTTQVELINQAADEAEENEDGVGAISTPSGIGLVANGTAFYTISANPDMTKASQRAAIVEAAYTAKANLAEYIYGLDLEAQTQLLSFSEKYVDETDTLMNMSKSQLEGIETKVRGALLGAVVYDFTDTEVEDGGMISMTIVTTPATRGMCATGASAKMLHADDIESAMQYIHGLVASGAIPPNGGKRILLKDGTVAWAAFGSGTVSMKITNPSLRNADRKAQSMAAEMRAKKNLLALIKGEEIEMGSALSASYGKAVKSYETVLDENGGESMRKLAEVEESIMSSTILEEKIKSEVKGTLPPGVITQMVKTNDAFWVTAVSYWYPPLTASAKQAMHDMANGGALANTPTDVPKGGYLTNPDGSPALKGGKMQAVRRPDYKADKKDL